MTWRITWSQVAISAGSWKHCYFCFLRRNHTNRYKHILIHRPLGKTQHTQINKNWYIIPVWSTHIINMDLYNTKWHCLIYLPVCPSINLSAFPSASPRVLTYNSQHTYSNTVCIMQNEATLQCNAFAKNTRQNTHQVTYHMNNVNLDFFVQAQLLRCQHLQSSESVGRYDQPCWSPNCSGFLCCSALHDPQIKQKKHEKRYVWSLQTRKLHNTKPSV